MLLHICLTTIWLWSKILKYYFISFFCTMNQHKHRWRHKHVISMFPKTVLCFGTMLNFSCWINRRQHHEWPWCFLQAKYLQTLPLKTRWAHYYITQELHMAPLTKSRSERLKLSAAWLQPTCTLLAFLLQLRCVCREVATMCWMSKEKHEQTDRSRVVAYILFHCPCFLWFPKVFMCVGAKASDEQTWSDYTQNKI